MKLKIGSDEFCLHCMECREYDEEGRCKICKHIIHRENTKFEKEGYNYIKSESPSYEDSYEDVEDYNY